MLLALEFIVASASSAQTFPSFGAPAEQSQLLLDAGVSSAQVPNGLYTSVLMSVYSYGGALNYSISTNGTTSAYNIQASGQPLTSSVGASTTVPYIDCLASHPSTCSASVGVFQGNIYITYADANTLGIDVIEAVPIANNVAYTFRLVYQSSAVNLTTSPAMTVFTNSDGIPQLVIIFGSDITNVNNAFYELTQSGSGTWSLSDSNMGGDPNLNISSASQPAVAELNGTLWLCSQQNNSSRYMFVYSSTDGTTWSFNGEKSLAMGSGGSMVVFNNTLVLATQQDSSAHDLFVFESTDGTNWTANQYTGIQIGSTPALSLYNGDLSLQFQSNSGDPTPLFTALASN